MTEQTKAPQNSLPLPALWLFFCVGAVLAMITIGAITRLTESGLSMVEWKPLIGILPPLSHTEWERVFALYQKSPEFQLKNSWMTLSDFKQIFFWEWFHRFWGQLIGMMYFFPLIWFRLKGQLTGIHFRRCIGLFVLVGLQGLMGWYMVKSGLVDRPAVSHYRLAAHLTLALLLLALTTAEAMALSGFKKKPYFCLFRHGAVTFLFLGITILWGAFTAGLDAGLVYNEFPLMGGHFFPPEMGQLSPAWRNYLENIPVVQFTHRWLAVTTMILILLYAGRAVIREKRPEASFKLLALMAFVQVGLGITTLLSGVWLPVAVIHQAGAAFLVVLMSASLYQSWPWGGSSSGSCCEAGGNS
ncbi:MAG: COX15/CtaA family protein [Alphaproteobacteria bacterium]|nr:COX15/CtaA family protein [Alphaproteobacteria bacterium]